MTRPSVRWFLRALPVLAVLAALGLWFGRASAPADAAAEASSDLAAPAEAARGGDEMVAPGAAELGKAEHRMPIDALPKAVVRTGANALEQPAPGTAIVDLIDALGARALAGDGMAACRLITELEVCRRVQYWIPEPERAPERFPGGEVMSEEQQQEWIRGVQRSNDANMEARIACEGVSELHHAQVPRYALAGAVAGNEAAMLAFVGGREITASAMMRDPSLATLYRQHAWPMFLQLWNAGNPRAVSLLAWAQRSPHVPVFAGVADLGWIRPGVVNALEHRIARVANPLLGGRPNGAFDEGDKAEADRLFVRHFEDSPWLATLGARQRLAAGAEEPYMAGVRPNLERCLPPPN